MKFVDSCDVDVIAGKGGNGAVAFRREKYVPFGGPSGGDGGRGGDVVFVADEGLSTLLDLAHVRKLAAKSGENGQGSDCYGRGADDLVVRVPVGTQVFDRETNELLFDVDEPKKKVIIAHGGRGGRGNIHFASPHDRAPRRAEPGAAGEEKRLRLELKVMADVGLLGFPNVGKSTFVSTVSRARPKVADYPFTTLTPHLGVVRVGDEATFVVADIPGLIPGAAEGAGLGHRFLKHVERCRALLHLVTLDPGEDRDPVRDYEALRKELAHYDPELAKRPEIVAMTKADLPEVREAFPGVAKRLAKKNVALRLVSAATGEGIRDLLFDLYRLVTGNARVDDWDAPAPNTPKARVEDRDVPSPRPKTKSAPKKKSAPEKKSAPKKKSARKPKRAATPPKKTKSATRRKSSAPSASEASGSPKAKRAVRSRPKAGRSRVRRARGGRAPHK